LEILKENFIKSIRIKAQLDISIMYPLGIEILINKKIYISKKLLKIRSTSNPSKVHNYYLIKVSLKKISHLTLPFHSSTHS
jgi:hypothetical protein